VLDDVSWNDNDSVAIRHHPVAPRDADAADLEHDITVLHDLPAASRVLRRGETGVKPRRSRMSASAAVYNAIARAEGSGADTAID
jgi:hypothetical protein